ncbi:sugar ABC transporter substrate-binding protein [Planctomycetales bacterium]|nr:sugar ABC transporter substrate-binding protein [Planctomycetales bacterium]GHT00716.1 sugar ABC transporter substrate-binding protein [Planctomycetales bacterium]GHT02524.1 sugar ABC transporter substrate-binding protein [Planctomycetales bacterium]GHV22181.1 sugar ABC transporter substrate-binding protein [Planctomycetales bacterium]
MFIDQSITQYLDALASGVEVPGGGSAAALAGAVGAATAMMAANFSLDPKKFAAVSAEVRDLLAQLQRYRAAMRRAVDDDAVAFGKFRAVCALPKNTSEEKARRDAALQKALTAAMQPPWRVMNAATAALRLLPRLAAIGNENLCTDTGGGAILLEAAVRAARLNVLVNLRYLKDEAQKKHVAAQVEEWRQTAASMVAKVEQWAEYALSAN